MSLSSALCPTAHADHERSNPTLHLTISANRRFLLIRIGLGIPQSGSQRFGGREGYSAGVLSTSVAAHTKLQAEQTVQIIGSLGTSTPARIADASVYQKLGGKLERCKPRSAAATQRFHGFFTCIERLLEVYETNLPTLSRQSL